MMDSLLAESRQLLREIPWTAVALLVAIVFGLGAHASIVYEADGEDLRLVANRQGWMQTAGPVLRLPARARSTEACGEGVPGFTVIVALSEYSVELSVPMAGMRSMLQDAQMKLTNRPSVCKRSMA